MKSSRISGNHMGNVHAWAAKWNLYWHCQIAVHHNYIVLLLFLRHDRRNEC